MFADGEIKYLLEKWKWVVINLTHVVWKKDEIEEQLGRDKLKGGH
jgi:hypothetical protein